MSDVYYVSRGFYTVKFRDADLPLVDTRHIVVPVCTANSISKRLAEDYRNNFLLSTGNFNLTYLISGIAVQVNRVSSSTEREFDEVVMSSENRDTANLLARSLGLPKIWEKSFILGNSSR